MLPLMPALADVHNPPAAKDSVRSLRGACTRRSFNAIAIWSKKPGNIARALLSRDVPIELGDCVDVDVLDSAFVVGSVWLGVDTECHFSSDHGESSAPVIRQQLGAPTLSRQTIPIADMFLLNCCPEARSKHR